MNKLVKYGQWILRTFFFGIILFTSNLGCAPAPVSTAFRATSSPNPKLTGLAELAPTKEIITRSPLYILSPTNSLALQTATPSPSAVPTQTLPTVALSEELVRDMLGKVSIDRALRDLRRLTGEDPICIDRRCYTITDRETGSEGLNWTKEYVYRELVSLGYSVEIQDWSNEGWADQNLIAKKSGVLQPEEEIYFVTHLDGVASSPAADDNGSGAVDLLELARILSNYSLSRTVVLLFTTGEEHGSLGSQTYIDQLSPEEISAIRYVTNIDMIGYDSDNDGSIQLWPGDHPPSLTFAEMIIEVINTYQIDLQPSIFTDCY
jgi:hypothetical protein